MNHWRHNVYTTDNDPYSYEDYPSSEIDMYADPSTGGYTVSIECTFDETLSEPTRILPTEQDADAYARQKAESLQQAYLATQK